MLPLRPSINLRQDKLLKYSTISFKCLVRIHKVPSESPLTHVRPQLLRRNSHHQTHHHPSRRRPSASARISQEPRESPMASPPPQISISADSMDEPPSYDEARNRNLSAHNPSDVPSLHTPSIIDLPHRSSHDAGPSNFDVPDIMPTLSMLSSPTELFPDATPYFLMLSCTGPSARLSGSHQPSLRLIAEYFKKWGRLSPPRPGSSASVRGQGTPFLPPFTPFTNKPPVWITTYRSQDLWFSFQSKRLCGRGGDHDESGTRGGPVEGFGYQSGDDYWVYSGSVGV